MYCKQCKYCMCTTIILAKRILRYLVSMISISFHSNGYVKNINVLSNTSMYNPYNEIQPYFQSMVMGQIMVSFLCMVFTEFDMERSRWSMDHKLNIDSDLADSQTSLIDNFKEDLYLCHYTLNYFGIFEYQHWYVTDMNWDIEFGFNGGLQLSSVSVIISKIAQSTTTVPNKSPIPSPKFLKSVVDAKFKLTGEIKDRMKKVCGARNFSVGLRNCEHLANYIYCGKGESFQVSGDGILRKLAFDYMAELTTNINSLPVDLKDD